LIIVSATVSSCDFAAAEMEILLDPLRLTVAISHPKRKIIVVASQTVLNLTPSNLDDYERGALWKHLRPGFRRTHSEMFKSVLIVSSCKIVPFFPRMMTLFDKSSTSCTS